MKKIICNYLPDTRCTVIAECPCVNCVLDYSVRRGRFVETELKGNYTYITVSTEFDEELRLFLESRGIKCTRKRSRVFGYRRRYGLILGAFVFLLIISYFSSLLWSLDVSGNQRLTDQEIRELLRECGVHEGVALKDINNDLVRIKIMSLSKDIAWISVNVKGMRAEVVVAEAERTPEKESSPDYSHIVASFDGLITGIVIERGQQIVKVGESVKKGDLLVSGIIEERDGDVSLVNASARVYAQTEREVTCIQPYKRTVVSVSEGKIERISLESLGKSIKFSLKYGLTGAEYDIIRKRGSVCIFDSFRLPVYYVAEYGIRKQVSTVSLTRDEARRMAESDAYRILFDGTDAELVSKRFFYDYADDGLTVRLHAVCEENIAQSIPFTAEP